MRFYNPMFVPTDPENREKVVIVGFGWVGQANALALSQLGYHVAYFDPVIPKHHYDEYAGAYKNLQKLSKVEELDAENTWYVVCVGDRVSDDGVQDISLIKTALDSLASLKGGVILRSTVLPGKLKDLRFDYYVPEFLHERSAVKECLDPHFFVVGKRKGVRQSPSFIPEWRKRAVKAFSGTPEEASYVKYLSNLWNSVRIAFANEFGDAVGEPKTKEDLASISRVVDFVLDEGQYLRYGRAFGGHCLPKDTRAFTRYLKDSVKNAALLDGVYRSNTAHDSIQKNYPQLPEWFSEWVAPPRSGTEALRTLRKAIWRNVRDPKLLLSRFSR